jgi:hypothetical protein
VPAPVLAQLRKNAIAVGSGTPSSARGCRIAEITGSNPLSSTNHRLAHLGAGTLRYRQRNDTQDEGQRGHQDRPQAGAGRIDSGRGRIRSGFFCLTRELDYQDSILSGQSYQNDEADLRQNVDG